MRKHSLLFLGFLVLAGCAPIPKELPALSIKTVILHSPQGQSHSITAEIADTEEARQRGLMFRERLPEGTGMLFVFPKESELSFWMRNTIIPLDILFFDSRFRLVDSASMEPCDAMPCPTTLSKAPAMYALELPVATIERWNITNGWRLELTNQTPIQSAP